MTGHHIGEEEFAELLAAEGSAETMAHLAGCEPCRVEVEQLTGALAAFRGQGLAWAEARVERLPAPARGLVAFPPSLQTVAAAALLACVALGGALQLRDAAQVPVVHEHAAQSLADDNRLLLAIDQELDTQDASPREAYATTRASVRN